MIEIDSKKVVSARLTEDDLELVIAAMEAYEKSGDKEIKTPRELLLAGVEAILSKKVPKEVSKPEDLQKIAEWQTEYAKVLKRADDNERFAAELQSQIAELQNECKSLEAIYYQYKEAAKNRENDLNIQLSESLKLTERQAVFTAEPVLMAVVNKSLSNKGLQTQFKEFAKRYPFFNADYAFSENPVENLINFLKAYFWYTETGDTRFERAAYYTGLTVNKLKEASEIAKRQPK